MAANRREIEDSWKSLQEKRYLSERQRVSVTDGFLRVIDPQ